MAVPIDEAKTLDVLHNGVKIGGVHDAVQQLFNDDKACVDFLTELKSLTGLPAKYSRTLDNCITVLSSANEEEVKFGPVEILQLAELAFRFPDHSRKIMSAVQYLLGCVVMLGSLPTNIFADLGSTYSILGGLPNKPLNDDDEDADLDDDEQFGYNLENSESEDE